MIYLKLAIVHDWLTNMGGAERLIVNFHELYPDAPIYTSVYNPEKLDKELVENVQIKTTFLQKNRKKVENHKKYFPLMPMAFESLDLNEYDVILSSSTCCAKGIIPHANTIHIFYCSTPMRYAWEKREDYVKGMGKLKKKLVSILMHYMRIWDVTSSARVDYFIANSSAVKERIKKYYNRDAVVINPAVRCSMFDISEKDEDYYFVVSRLVGYKRFDLAVQACIELNKNLVVIGDGPELENLKKMAEGHENIKFLGAQNTDVIKKYMSEGKALLFPGEEDFGIAPVESMACGRPVIAYGKGGVLDSVVDGKTGVFFYEQTVEAVKEAIIKSEGISFNKKEIREYTFKFDETEFKKKIKEFIERKIIEKKEKNDNIY
jgi:glycosyltransferase involved in cell wall biosynthesis